MNVQPIIAVLVHVANVPEALAWYGRAFPNSVRTRIAVPEFEFLLIDGVQLEIVPADSKVSSGPCGSVVYWSVPHFEEALAHFQSVGAKLYRGPLRIEDGQCMCQVQDAWGNCIGIRGLSHASET
jgi:predicted enzyme related to lactoylglutathione lyase